MAMTYRVRLAVTLQAVYNDRALSVKIGIDENLTVITLVDSTTVNFEFDAVDTCCLNVELLDKQDQEAVIVQDVSFFGITDPKFAWAGVYEPTYPEPWASEQKSQGITLKPQLSPHTYLSWPGKWTLTFTAPVFTWIHNIQNLGWIYR
jgi:hypothetical protein